MEEDRDGVGAQDIVDRLDTIIGLLRPAPAEPDKRADGTELVQEPASADGNSGGREVRSQ